nr:unnamed protein product [Callosobruchus chinensis]
MEWSQQIVLVLLEEYQKREILWKPRHPLYYNTIKKEDAWREIAAILNVEVQELKKKMESLKGSFRREKSRVKKGTGTGKEELMFVRKEKKTRTSRHVQLDAWTVGQPNGRSASNGSSPKKSLDRKQMPETGAVGRVKARPERPPMWGVFVRHCITSGLLSRDENRSDVLEITDQ